MEPSKNFLSLSSHNIGFAIADLSTVRRLYDEYIDGHDFPMHQQEIREVVRHCNRSYGISVRMISRHGGLSRHAVTRFLQGAGKPAAKTVTGSASGCMKALSDGIAMWNGLHPTSDQVELRPSGSADWTALPRDKNKQLILRIVSGLEALLPALRRPNDQVSIDLLTPLERRILVDTLDTTLALLKEAPLVERTLLGQTKDGLGSVARRAAEKQLDATTGEAAKSLRELIGQLMKDLFT
jgi:hypothetical protein